MVVLVVKFERPIDKYRGGWIDAYVLMKNKEDKSTINKEERREGFDAG